MAGQARRARDTGGTLNITVTAEKPTDEKMGATLTIPAAEVDAAVKSAYKEIAKKYNFQGFRRGHAPRPVIDGIVGRESVLAQATNDLLNAAEPLMLEELDVTPVGRVSFGAEDADPELVVEGTDYVVTAVIGVRPSCELESYDAPKINMPPEEATERTSRRIAAPSPATSSPSTSRTSTVPVTSPARTVCSPSTASRFPSSSRRASSG